MANSLTALSPTYWSRRMGRKLYKTDIFRSQANFEEQAVLTDGATVDRPYRADIVVEDYTKGTALTAQDLTATSNTLTVNVIKAALLYVDNVDKIQNKYSAANAWIDELSRRLSNALDAYYLYEVFNAADTIDDGDVGGTAGYGITVETTNILDVFGAINLKLDVLNVPEEERFLNISPHFYNVLWKYIAGKASLLGDKTGETGNIGTYASLKLFKTNNLTGSARWTPVDNPSNTATITIQGITFTFVSTISTVAGNILQTTSLAVTIDNLVALINAGGVGDDTNYYSLSTANKRTVQMWVAVDGTTYFEIRCRGTSYLTLTTSEAADVWNTQYQLENLFAGRYKCVDVVVQKNPSVEMDSTVGAGKSGMNILGMSLSGNKTFYQGTYEMLKVQVRSDAY